MAFKYLNTNLFEITVENPHVGYNHGNENTFEGPNKIIFNSSSHECSDVRISILFEGLVFWF